MWSGDSVPLSQFTIKFYGVNSSTLRWEDAFSKLINIENSNSLELSPLPLLQLIEVGSELEDSISLSVSYLIELHHFSFELTRKVCQQVIEYFPVW